MRIHFLQHVAFEGPGSILEWAELQQYEISFTRFFEADFRLPEPDELDALVIMGGPMGVNDGDRYTWLNAEKEFIYACIQAGKKVLGICLGAQLIAASLGAAVRKAPNKEIGWFPVAPAEACLMVDWFYELFKNQPTVYHWHGDQFDIPQGGLNLLLSAANENQAFAYQDNVLGLQFHLEVSRYDVIDMIQHGWSELDHAPYIQGMACQITGCTNVRTAKRTMNRLLDIFLAPTI